MAAPMSAHVSTLPEDVQELLLENEPLIYNAEKNKICCRLSGHEMPCTAKAVRSYICGKKYNKLRHDAQYDHSRFREHIVPNTKRGLEHLLFCKLTLRHINNVPADIDVHVTGRKFQRALAKWESCQKTGETFKPLTSMKQKGPSTSWDRPQKRGRRGDNSDSDHEEDEDNQSDLSDLYPEADFASDEDEADASEVEDEAGSGSEDTDGEVPEDDRLRMDAESDSDFEDMESTSPDSRMENAKTRTEKTTGDSDNHETTLLRDKKSPSSSRKRSLPKSLKQPKNLSSHSGKKKKAVK